MSKQADDGLRAARTQTRCLPSRPSNFVRGIRPRLILLARELHAKPPLPVRRMIGIQRGQRGQHLVKRTESIRPRVRIAQRAQLDRLDAPDTQPPHARRERAAARLHAWIRPPAERRPLRARPDRFPEALLEQELPHA